MDEIEKIYKRIEDELNHAAEATKAATTLSTDEMIKAIYDVLIGEKDADDAAENAAETEIETDETEIENDENE